MPIDIDQLKLLVKFAAAVPQDKGSQAMAAAAQAAKPSGGIPLPKTIEEESPAEGALSAEQQQREQEKLEQQRRKELEAKENEIRGLQHELDLERVERQKMTNRHELDMQVRQEEARLKAEKDKLEKERFQLVQEKARQDNLFKAEEMKHQATLDKATYKQEAEIAKVQAKSTADLAKQQAQSLIATNDKARKASDKYYADASARLTKEHPSISPALQIQLDGAIASLNRFRKVHNKQLALPKPGTPPSLAKTAAIKWAAIDMSYLPDDYVKGIHEEQAAAGVAPQRPQSTPSPTTPPTRAAQAAEQRRGADFAKRNVVSGGSAYDAIRAAAYYNNEAAKFRHKGNMDEYNYYSDLARQANSIAVANYRASKDRADRASYESYMDPKSTINGFNSHKAYRTTESQYDRDANAFADEQARKNYEARGGDSILGSIGDFFGTIVSAPHNAWTNSAANFRNADRFTANRLGETTFDDPGMEQAYWNSITNHGYGDSPIMDVADVAVETGLAAASVFGAGKAAKPLLTPFINSGKTAVMDAGKRVALNKAKQMGTEVAERAAQNAARQKAKATAAEVAKQKAAQNPWLYGKRSQIWKAPAGLTGYATADAATPETHIGKSNLDFLSPDFAPKGYGFTDPLNMRSGGNGPEYNPSGVYQPSLVPSHDPYAWTSDQFLKSSSVLPMPGDKPVFVKSATDRLIAQVANDYYDGRNINSSYFRDPYSGHAKFLGRMVRSLTGGMIDPYKQIRKHDMFLHPEYPVTATNLMQNTIHETGASGNSNVHKVIERAATQKHAPEELRNYNGTTYRPQTGSSREFTNQLTSALT